MADITCEKLIALIKYFQIKQADLRTLFDQITELDLDDQEKEAARKYLTRKMKNVKGKIALTKIMLKKEKRHDLRR